MLVFRFGVCSYCHFLLALTLGVVLDSELYLVPDTLLLRYLLLDWEGRDLGCVYGHLILDGKLVELIFHPRWR